MEKPRGIKITNVDNQKQCDIHVVMWRFFSDEMPEPYKKVRVDTTEEIIETKTYKHSGKLLLKCVDGNEHFIGFSPKLLNEKSKWCYV